MPARLRDEQGRFTKQLAMAEAKPDLRLFNKELAEMQLDEDRAGKPTSITTYDGSSATFRKFTSDIDLRFLFYPTRYNTDKLRMAEVTSNCTGRASDWCITVLTTPEHESKASYTAFVDGFIAQFSDRAYINKMQIQYMAKHTSGSVAQFTQDFEAAAHALGIHHTALAVTYLSHMNEGAHEDEHCALRQC